MVNAKASTTIRAPIQGVASKPKCAITKPGAAGYAEIERRYIQARGHTTACGASRSTLNARRLGSSRLQLVASPEYLAGHGQPASSEDLIRHRLLGFTAPASLNIWPLSQAGGDGLTIVPVIATSSGETLRHLALAGISCLSHFLVDKDIASGQLVKVLPEITLPWSQPIWAVFYKQKALAPRVAAFVNFLAQRFDADKLGVLEAEVGRK